MIRINIFVLFVCFISITTISIASSIRIMPFGDSITVGFLPDQPRSSYRVIVEERLDEVGIDFEFVGDFANGSSNPEFRNKRYQAHGGWGIQTLAREFVDVDDRWNPDIVLLLAGTNNHWATNFTTYDFEGLYIELFGIFGDAYIIAATVPDFGYPRNTHSFWTEEFVDIRNDQVFPTMRESLRKVVNDQDQGLIEFAAVIDTDIHLEDAVHPNTEGHEVLGDLFADAIIDHIYPQGSYIPEQRWGMRWTMLFLLIAVCSLRNR